MTYSNNAQNDPAVQAGWSVGDYGIVTADDSSCIHCFTEGSVVKLVELDGTDKPDFVCLSSERTQYICVTDGVQRVPELPRAFYTHCSQQDRTRLKESPALQSLGKWLDGQDFADSDISWGVTDYGWLQFDGTVWHGEVGDTPYPDAGAVAISLEELKDWATVVDAQAEYSSAYTAKSKIKEEEALKTPAEKLGLKAGSKVVAVSPRSDSNEVRVGDVLELVRDDTSPVPYFRIERTGKTRYYFLSDTRPYKPAPEVLTPCQAKVTPCQALGIVQGAVCFLKEGYITSIGTHVLSKGDIVVLTCDDGTKRPGSTVLASNEHLDCTVFVTAFVPTSLLQPTGLILEQYAAKK